MFEAAEKSFASPSPSDDDGKSILLKAATEPLIPTKRKPKTATASNSKILRGALITKDFPPLENQAVKANAASNENVMTRCAAIQKGRVGVKFSAVFPVKTNPAPIRASKTMKMNEANAVLRTRSFLLNLTTAQINNPDTKINASPVDKRCENSIIV